LRKGSSFIGVLGLMLVGLAGCADYNNRPPASAAEVKAADDKRQAYVDTLTNLTPEQKAQMKAHMGGPPAPSPGGPPAAGSGRPEGNPGG